MRELSMSNEHERERERSQKRRAGVEYVSMDNRQVDPNERHERRRSERRVHEQVNHVNGQALGHADKSEHEGHLKQDEHVKRQILGQDGHDEHGHGHEHESFLHARAQIPNDPFTKDRGEGVFASGTLPGSPHTYHPQAAVIVPGSEDDPGTFGVRVRPKNPDAVATVPGEGRATIWYVRIRRNSGAKRERRCRAGKTPCSR